MPASSSPFTDPTVNLHGTLLDAVATTTDGEWMNVEGYDKISIHLIIASATVILCGSNEDNPLNSTHGVDLVAAKLADNIAVASPGNISASTIVLIKAPLKWIKARVTVNSGSVSAPFVAV
jgi:hypothetical protein